MCEIALWLYLEEFYTPFWLWEDKVIYSKMISDYRVNGAHGIVLQGNLTLG